MSIHLVHLLCLHPSETVTNKQSLIPCASVLDECSCPASRQIVSWQKDKDAQASSASCLDFPWTGPAISDELELVSRRRQTTIRPIVLH